MLTSYRPRFIEKTLTDSFGRQYRVLFAVSFVDGEVRGRVISATLIQNVAQLDGDSVYDHSGSHSSNGAFLLSGFSSKKEAAFEYVHAAIVVSPYFSLEYLLNSQPTRAPSRD